MPNLLGMGKCFCTLASGFFHVIGILTTSHQLGTAPHRELVSGCSLVTRERGGIRFKTPLKERLRAPILRQSGKQMLPPVTAHHHTTEMLLGAAELERVHACVEIRWAELRKLMRMADRDLQVGGGRGGEQEWGLRKKRDEHQDEMFAFR